MFRAGYHFIAHLEPDAGTDSARSFPRQVGYPWEGGQSKPVRGAGQAALGCRTGRPRSKVGVLSGVRRSYLRQSAWTSAEAPTAGIARDLANIT